jgi:hypothetical protein
VKISTDPLLAELWPDGTFGGARPRRANIPPRTAQKRAAEQQRRGSDTDAAKHLAALAAEVAAIDKSRGYGVNTRYRRPAPDTRTPAAHGRNAA